MSVEILMVLMDTTSNGLPAVAIELSSELIDIENSILSRILTRELQINTRLNALGRLLGKRP